MRFDLPPTHAQITPAPVRSAAAPTTTAAPAPPASWSRWWKTPVAKLEYGPQSRIEVWPEAWLSASRTIAGDRMLDLVYGGTTRDAAVAAARMLAARPVTLDIDVRGGRTRSVELSPAFAVLHDAAHGAFWLAPLQATMRSHGQWIDAPHSIDGVAFEGRGKLLDTPRVYASGRTMVAIVGRDTVVTPERWADAPDDTTLDVD